ncbi:MAG: hypothetical protein GAK44_00288 [Pseudomonas delhiensis]|nr:MAG: hypothetical protein GAK44_00288 [Pseudomonas delhiensis]
MADADLADQALHMALLEDVANQAVVLAQVELVILAGDDAGSVLATVLENGKRIIERLVDVRLAHDTDDATHATQPLFGFRLNNNDVCRLRESAPAGYPAGSGY